MQVGINQITFVGLTPSIDQHSVKIEGVGTATISDTTVELLPNREIFHDVYPESDSDNSDTPDEENHTKRIWGTEELLTVREQMEQLRTEQEYATELTKSADSRLKLLDSYEKSVTEMPYAEVDIEETIATYKAEREKLFEDDSRFQLDDPPLFPSAVAPVQAL
ncbi:hypothetical protein F4820DRAFT_410991, partial [Hypoxylon rubiginosum]